ncbi:MAG: patatin family protein [Eubacteriales bacterium]|nr:patatin family protein [Eubacteriales bacterium]
MKTGLILEGGAMRGIYTAGVLDVFLENNIFVDGVIGVSAGAIHGCSYVSKQRGRSIRYYMNLCRKWRFMSFRSLLLTGNLVNTKFCYDQIPNHLDPYDYDTFAASDTEFYVTCTNLRTGKAEYKHCTDFRKDMDWMRASASMPLVSSIVWIDGEPYLDGGVADSIPYKAFCDLGFDRNIVVLTQVAGYQKKSSRMNNLKHAYKKYPLFRRAMKNRPNVYNNEVAEIEAAQKRGEVLIIRPSRELNVHRMEKDRRKLMTMYKLGRHDARKKLPEIKRFLAAKNISENT